MPSPAQDDRIVAASVRAAGSSFYWAMRLQSPQKRAGLFAIYAFCREVDDIADGDADVPDPVRALEAWSARVEALFEGEADETPLERSLVRAIDAFGLRRIDFLAVIEGMLMDANGPIQRPDMKTLTHYCDCVASAVGRLCIGVFGDASPPAKKLASEQGQALQLTNILRDIEEDAARGRIYVPMDILKAHRMHTVQPSALIGHPGLVAVRADLGALAQARFDAAEAEAALCDQSAIRPAMMMMDAYRQTFDSWAANDWQQPASSVVASLKKRGLLMGKALGLWIRQG